MNLVRTILIVTVVVLLTLFAVANDVHVALNFGVASYDVWLPLVILVSFLAGLLPVWLSASAQRLLLNRRVTKLQAALDKSEASLSQAKVELLRPPVAAGAPVTAPKAELPQALHLPTPPAGA
ncbi:lipopolysaccharide assembly protein LapA domain-containing protein [Sandaracinobacteroides saxicola]|uniref:LapA family protein n=1 Tax=Sandaracinobacteroides saxicola TaxID=2759707 RepID=A0A7G5IH35_9SPHN|nr:LapA family protein [Sandaracinobacteroides saxicola]QMW22677.1 LapA family protein [Sandaracinobacteroides saxicola]